MTNLTLPKIEPTPPITFVVKPWSEMTRDDVYYMLKLRSDVFINEQNCVYPDIDDKDQRAIHVMGYITHEDKNELVVYSRVFNGGDYCDQFTNSCLGRVVCATAWRRYGYGHQLLDKAIEVLLTNFTCPVSISAQQYLERFYASHGFQRVNDEDYLEDGIPHVEMILLQSDLTGDNEKHRSSQLPLKNQ